MTGKLKLVLGILLLYFSRNTWPLQPARFKRHLPLIYTNSSAITFICGFGIPVNDLELESVIVGVVFKAQQVLPSTVQALRQPASHSINTRPIIQQQENLRSHTAYQSSSSREKQSGYRFMLYKVLELLSASFGELGRNCLLKAICQATQTPFHYNNGLLGEIVHILLTPSSSLDVYSTQADSSYARAEQYGRRDLNCEKIFQCNRSILDRITNTFD